MNCVHCGKRLYPEAPFCPHCGRPNENRIRLDEGVDTFDRGYSEALDGVRSAVRRKNRFAGKVAAMVVLIALLLASVFADDALMGLAYDVREKAVRDNIDEIILRENEYLDAEDYFGLLAYTEYLRGAYYINSAAPEYYTVNYTVREYCETFRYICSYLEEAGREEPYHDTLVSRARTIREDLKLFYEYSDPEHIGTQGKAQERLDAVDNMKRNLEAMLSDFFDMPSDEAASLATATEGEREVMIERYVHP